MNTTDQTQQKKTGFFGRLFGGKQETPPAQPEHARQEESPAEEALAESSQEVKSAELVTVQESAPLVSAEDITVPSHEVEDAEALVQAPEDAKPFEQSELTEETSSPHPEKKSWFQRLKAGLSKSSTKLSEGITGIFTKAKLDDDTLEQLEDTLIQADLGVDTAMRITERLAKTRYNKNVTAEEVRAILADEVKKVLEPVAKPLIIDDSKKPYILLMIGVNGAGKTTTIGKLAQKYTKAGKKVMLAAGDTFRAAAIEQLKVWGERTNSPVIARDQGSDAAGLVFDALKEAKEQNCDILMIDTAGRLQNKAHLMAELEKVVRVIKKFDDTAPHSSVLILDATTGQNAMSQAEIFGKSAQVSGIIMTKLDGTARGGILVAIADKFGLPVHAIGVGEGIDDLQPFEPQDFAEAIAS